jgi:hypothetical protein
LLKLLFFVAKLVGNIPISKIYLPSPNILVVMLYYLFIIIFLLNKKSIRQEFKLRQLLNYYLNNYKTKIKVLIVLVIFAVLIINILPKNYIELKFIDVGQRRL